MKESYSVIIEFRDLAHTAKQFVRHPPQYPENLSNSVNIILLFLCIECWVHTSNTIEIMPRTRVS